jgi:RNA-directed DNA polymerase
MRLRSGRYCCERRPDLKGIDTSNGASRNRSDAQSSPAGIGPAARNSRTAERSIAAKVWCLPVLFEQVSSRRALRAAWHRVRKRRPVPGADGVTVEIFEAEADTHLEALRSEILDGHYAPQPLRRILLRKEGGGERPVALPSLRDRIVQDALLHALRSPIELVLGQGAHAYRPGRSAITALEAVQEGLSGGSSWILKGDIVAFFDTLDHELLRVRLTEIAGDDPVVELVMRCVTGLVLDEMSLWDNRVGAPQGLSLSPLMSNLYMVPFDREMQIASLNLVRYADDFVVLCSTREEADSAERTARGLLAGLRLQPKEEKWSVVSVSDGFVFLGYHFDDRGRGPSRKAVAALSWRLESARDDLAKLTPTFEQQVECFRPIIRGWLGYFETLPQLGPAWAPPMVAAATLEVASSLAMEDASDILIRYVEANGAALTTTDHLGLAGVAESLGLMWISLRERAQALHPGAATSKEDPSGPEARTALAQSLGGAEHVEEFLRVADAFLETDCGPSTRDSPAEEEAWTLAEFLIMRGCQAAAYQMLRATGAGPREQAGQVRAVTVEPSASDGDIAAFLSLFSGRESGYAEEIRTDDGRRVLLYMDSPLGTDAVREHLAAERTLAIYLCREEATVTACVVDVDIGKRSLLLHPPGSPGFPRLLAAARSDGLALASALRAHGVPSYVEWTGRRGYHVWVFLEQPVPVEAARQALQAVLGAVGNQPDGVTREILPKEPGVGTGQRGGAVKLPLGVHVQTGDRSLFLDDSGHPISSPWDHVRAMGRVQATAFLRLAEDCRPPELPRLPRIPKRGGIVPEIAAALPDGPVKQVVSGCAAVAFLVEKARRTGYLNHQERITLLLVLGHVGTEGKAFLEEVMRWCLNYDSAITRKFMRRMFGKPVSCPKLRERHPEVVAGVACECRFPLSRRMYPSPVLHAVAPKEVAAGAAEVAVPVAEVAATALRPSQLDRLAKLRSELAGLEAAVKRCRAQVDELLTIAETAIRE